MPAVTPQPQPDQQARRSGKDYLFRLEAAGLVIIGALILILTLVHYWHRIAWSAR